METNLKNTSPVIQVPYERPVTYSSTKVPKEVPLEMREYFPDGVVDCAAMVVQFDGNTYHLLDESGGSKCRDAFDIDTGEIVTLDFSDVT